MKEPPVPVTDEKAYDRVMRPSKETVEGLLEAGGVDGGGRASTVAGEPSYFVIAKGSSLLCRYKSEAAYADGKSFPEEFELDGASFFLKAKKADAVVFIVDGPDGSSPRRGRPVLHVGGHCDAWWAASGWPLTRRTRIRSSRSPRWSRVSENRVSLARDSSRRPKFFLRARRATTPELRNHV